VRGAATGFSSLQTRTHTAESTGRAQLRDAAYTTTACGMGSRVKPGTTPSVFRCRWFSPP